MNYKEIIESRYNREAWQGLLHDIFHNNVKFWSNPIPIQVSSRLAKTALRLGNITLSDGENIAVYEVELNEKVDISRNKRGIRDMLTSDWRGMGTSVPLCSVTVRTKAPCAFLMSARRGTSTRTGTIRNDRQTRCDIPTF